LTTLFADLFRDPLMRKRSLDPRRLQVKVLLSSAHLTASAIKYIMNRRSLAICLILIASSCVDRIIFDVDLPQELPLAVSGYISNQPGPYQVYLSSSFDTQSNVNLKNPISAKQVVLFDELGNSEELMEIGKGIYQTSETQGRVGGIYTLKIELVDGRIYESLPDTLLAPGQIDSLYYVFTADQDFAGVTSYGFDISINAQGNEENDLRYMWSMTGTFKAETQPWRTIPGMGSCYPIPELSNRCNFIPLCTGLRNVSLPYFTPAYERVSDCECCTCWYQVFTSSPILSDDFFTAVPDYAELPIYRVPLDEWIFMFKIHVQVSQKTLTERSFRFFGSIRDQKEAIGSLFQPISGKIPGAFVQIAGTPTPISGLFYAAGISSRSMYITPYDVPGSIPVPIVNYEPRNGGPGQGWVSCLELFPNATNVKPTFWED